tara:strand:- start:54 stop:1037 length:984 start_codon:yes stop_codon:yes gene_type:complete
MDKFISKISLYLTAIILAVAGIYLFIFTSDVECQGSGVVMIPSGSSVGDVANVLVESGCVESKGKFKLAMRMSFRDRRLMPGRYNLDEITKMGQLVMKLTSPSKHFIEVTVIEGTEMADIASQMKRDMGLDYDLFMDLCKNNDYISSLGIEAPTLEGYLYPDTYRFLDIYTEKDVIGIMVGEFHKKIQELGTDLDGYTVNEVVTLASIIQGEAQIIDEMPMISSVYTNRLRFKRKLEADPTVQYVVPGPNRRLLYEDLKIDHPYNTYKYKGLPPGAINSPGIDALKSAVNPAKSDYLYFVADGSGGHIFSKTNKEHVRAVQRIRRKK